MRDGRTGRRRATTRTAVVGVVAAALLAGLTVPEMASAVPERALTNSVQQVVVAPAVAGGPTAVTVRLGAGTTDPAVLDVIVGFAPVVTLPLHDDGVDGDPVAGDGDLTALIPAQAAGTLVRHRVRVGAGSAEVVVPVKDGKRRYDGFVVARPAVTTALPVLDWYLSDADAAWLAANRSSKEYVPAVLVIDGRVIDGAEVRNQGGFTAAFSPKPNVKFKLPGSIEVADPYFDLPVDEFVADADYEDPTSAIGRTSWSLLAAAGVPTRQTATARVERNGAFYGVYQLYQESDGTWFDQLPYEAASFYEGQPSEAQIIDEGDAAKLATRWELVEGDGTADLESLVEAMDGAAGAARYDVLADRFDVPRLVDLLAMSALIQNYDSNETNLDLIHGTDGRWRIVPNDLDLTLGLRGRARRGSLTSLTLRSATFDLRADGELAEMVTRRTRTLYDQWFADDRILDDVQSRVAAMSGDLTADRAAWPLAVPTPAVGLADLEDFLAHQRSVMESETADGVLPTSSASTAVRVSEVAASGGAGDFIELANVDPVRSADLSGWTLGGAAVATLPGGSVLAAGSRLVVPVSPAQIAALGRGVLVSGRLAGPLPASGTVAVRDAGGVVRDEVTWTTGAGWPAATSPGQTLEAKALDATRATGAGWVRSAAVGGTPGEAGASARGLDVRVSAGLVYSVDPAGTPLRISVANAGPGPRTGIELDGPGTGCDRSLGTLAAGSSVVVACPSPPPAVSGVRSLRTTVRSVEEPSGATDAPLLFGTDGGPSPEAPVLTGVRLGSGQLLASYTAAAPVPSGGASWKTVAEAATPTAWQEQASVLGTSPAPLAAAIGQPSRVRLVSRSSAGTTSLPSISSPVLTSRAAETWPFANGGALVDRWYRDLAGRAPTAAERATWTATIAGNGGPADLGLTLLASSRWAGAVDPLVRTYLAHFGRLPDPSGMRYWTAKRQAGMSLARVNAQFAGSSEFARRYDGLATDDLVTAVYRNVFDRDPDPSGQAYWTRKVEGGYPVGTMVLSFSESSEGIRRKAPTTAAVVTWFALHGTLPSTAWRTDAEAWIRAGGDRGTLVDSARSTDAYAAGVD